MLDFARLALLYHARRRLAWLTSGIAWLGLPGVLEVSKWIRSDISLQLLVFRGPGVNAILLLSTFELFLTLRAPDQEIRVTGVM